MRRARRLLVLAYRTSLLAASLAWRFVRVLLRGLAVFLVGLFHRSVLAGLLLAGIPAIAFGIAAMQVIPLVELGFFSFRGAGVNYQFATSYSLPVQNLINLLFPYFFRYTNRFYWTLWSEWETTLYVGIAPLVLAGAAVLFVRSRLVLLFAALATASVVLAFGDYSPWPLYQQLYHLPGFSSLRVPGRFIMLVTFCIAVLAAYGTDWLCRTLRPSRTEDLGLRTANCHAERSEASPSQRRPFASLRVTTAFSSALSPQSFASAWRWLCGSLAVNGFALYLLGLLIGMAGVVWWLVGFRLWIEKEPWAVKRFVETSYLSLRTFRPYLTSDMILNFLNYSLDITNQKTAQSLALMLATFLLLLAWFAFRRLWRIWAGLLVGLVAVDLMLFAADFHPVIPISQLATPDPAVRWLMAQNRNGMERVYTTWEAHKTEANRLLPYGVSEVTGYSSLETTRHQEFMGTVNDNEKTLLDLYSVRFVVMPKRFPAMPSYEYTAYNPNRPLADGPAGNRSSHVTFYMTPPVKADAVAFISNMRGAVEVPQGAEVADIVVVDTQGERTTLRLRAGQDTAEWAYDRPDVIPFLAHRKPQVADKISVTDPDGRRYDANLYFSEQKLDRTRTVARVEFHYIYPTAKMRLYGLMLWENPSTAHQVLNRDRYIPRYEDDEVLISENPSRLPHALLVPSARIVKKSQIMDTMSRGNFDPEKEVLLEVRDSPRPLPIPLPDEGEADGSVSAWERGSSPDGPAGSAQILDYKATDVKIETASQHNAVLLFTDSYYPGWKAFVDGQEQKVYRADYLFRAVLLPAGKHEVRFKYDPWTVALGADISVFTISTLLGLWAILLVGVPLFKGGRFLWRRARARPVPQL